MRKIKIEGDFRVTDAETGTNILCPLTRGLLKGVVCNIRCAAYALSEEAMTASYVNPNGGAREQMRWGWREHTCCALPAGKMVLGITGDYPTDDPRFKRAKLPA